MQITARLRHIRTPHLSHRLQLWLRSLINWTAMLGSRPKLLRMPSRLTSTELSVSHLTWLRFDLEVAVSSTCLCSPAFSCVCGPDDLARCTVAHMGGLARFCVSHELYMRSLCMHGPGADLRPSALNLEQSQLTYFISARGRALCHLTVSSKFIDNLLHSLHWWAVQPDDQASCRQLLSPRDHLKLSKRGSSRL